MVTKLLLQPQVGRQILEVTSGRTPIVDAVRSTMPDRPRAGELPLP
jgi:hypothetical protein